jgi:RNase H-like domain found in reverse transcriptase
MVNDTLHGCVSVSRRRGACSGETGEKPRTICFVSKALTKTEKNYQQVQREALAIVWSVERLFYYLLGRRFTIRTDARGLAFIFNKDKVSCTRVLNRAEVWALRLSTYDYVIEWIKGSENIAYPPSRLCASHTPFKHEVRTPGAICELTERTQELTGLTSELVRRTYTEDREAQDLLTALNTGKVAPTLKRYEKIKHELRASNGVAKTDVAPEVLLFGRIRRGALPTEGPTARAVNREELAERDRAQKERYRQREDSKRGTTHENQHRRPSSAEATLKSERSNGVCTQALHGDEWREG